LRTRSFHVSLLTGAALATMMIMAPGALASTRAVTPSPSPSSNAQVPVQQGTDVLPGSIARNVLAILGLTNYGPFSSQAVHVNRSVAKPQAGSPRWKEAGVAPASAPRS
jgi:hypothetical protein